MLLILAVILFALWLVGVFFHIFGWLAYIFLVVAVVLLIFHFLRRPRP